MLPLRSLISLALLNLVAMPVYATTLAEAAVRDALTGGSFSPICVDGGSGETEADANCFQDNNYGWGRARVNHGSLETYAKLSSSGPPTDNNDYQTYGWARFEDRLSVGSGLLTPGEWTDARIVIDLDGASYANVVPEPTTALLLGVGLAGLALRRRLAA